MVYDVDNILPPSDNYTVLDILISLSRHGILFVIYASIETNMNNMDYHNNSLRIKLDTVPNILHQCMTDIMTRVCTQSSILIANYEY